ncbi:MAG: hypothetical protein AAGF97_02140 [Planctomycetota bacterium]
MDRLLRSTAVFAATLFPFLGSVSADNHAWNTGAGNWSDVGNWSPAALPISTDTVSLGDRPAAENAFVRLDMNDTVSGVAISDGIAFRTDGHTLTVLGDTTVSGENQAGNNVIWPSRLIVERGVGTDDYDTDDLTLTNDGEVDLRDGGILEVDGLFSIATSSALRGDGVVDFEGDLPRAFAHDGMLQAGVDGMTLNQNGTGLLDLDGLTGTGRLHIAGGLIDGTAHSWLTVNATQLHDAFSGTITLGSDNILTMNLSGGGWRADANSEINFVGSSVDGPAWIQGSDLTVAGAFNVLHNTLISPHVTFEDSAVVDFNTNDDVRMVNGAEFQGPTVASVDPGASITPEGTVTVTANTTIDLPNGFFDLDGNSASTSTTISPGVAFVLNVDAIENDGDGFDGDLSISAGGSVVVNTSTPWQNEGTVDLFQATLSGSGVENTGTIRGSGTLDIGYLNNNGLIQASDGSDLILESDGFSDLDGSTENGSWQAVAGNIVINGHQGLFAFDGTISVGAVRSFTMTTGGLHNDGTINLSGRFFGDLDQRGTLTTSGILGARIVSSQGTFGSGSTNTLNGTLNLEGNFVIEAGANFSGPASLVNQSGSMLMGENGAALSVRLVNRGQLALEGPGQMTVSSWEQTETGTLAVGILDDSLGNFDQLVSLGTADLDGNIDVSLLPGETFDLYETAEVLLAPGGITGIFETVTGVILNATEGLAVTYEATTVDVTRAILGDANLDGVVDGQDFVAWNSNKFSSGTSWATGDFNGDGVTDGQDFVHWNTNKFMMADAGLANAVVAVPEPGLSLWLLAGCAWGWRRRRCAHAGHGTHRTGDAVQ